MCGDLLADFLSRCPRQQTIAPFDRESLTRHSPAWFKAIINNSHPAGNG